MTKLIESLDAWGTALFNATLKREIESLPAGRLPLQQCVRQGSYALDDNFSVMVLSINDDGDAIGARIGIFFNSIIAGCSCADDPTPVETLNEYCEFRLTLDKEGGTAHFTRLD